MMYKSRGKQISCVVSQTKGVSNTVWQKLLCHHGVALQPPPPLNDTG